MTAEIAVMNKMAVALAADSAVTTKTIRGVKIYNTNKLFKLSKHHPVGIMIYGRAELLGVPWETIIKEYRQNYLHDDFDRLEDFADDFIAFLGGKNPFFSVSQQKRYAAEELYSFFGFINEIIEKKVEEKLRHNRLLRSRHISVIASEVINEKYLEWKDAEPLPEMPVGHERKIRKGYEDLIEEATEGVFQRLPIYKKDKYILAKLAGLFLCKGFFDIDTSGIVIAGFGKKDFFPKLQEYQIETILEGCLKYRKRRHGEISFDISAYIAGFAQEDMIIAFMEGVDSSIQKIFQESLRRILAEYPSHLIRDLKGLPKTVKEEIKARGEKFGKKLYDEFFDLFEKAKRDNFVSPVTTVIDVLPKEELAAMAESLVNLTSFKRRVSVDSETVGGPIDVAVISKGDGFVWIKRNFYFDRELNPWYFATHMKGEEI